MFLEIINIKSNDITRENANMNADTPAGMMMKFASETTKPFVDDYLLSEEVLDAVSHNYLHIHDKDYYPTKSLTCVQHPLDRILTYGFSAGHGESRPAKRIDSYGPEMRGGTANVTVILSDRKISSPIAHEFDTAIILNQQSMEKFEPMVKPGGVLIYDTNGITRHPVRTDIEVYSIDATAECAKMGQAKLFNTMILGGYLKVRPVVEMENVMVGLKKSLPERAWKMLPENEKAIHHGGEIIKKIR